MSARNLLTEKDLRSYTECENPRCGERAVEYDVNARLKDAFNIAFPKKCDFRWQERAGTSGIGNATWKWFIELKAARRSGRKAQSPIAGW